MAHAPTARRDPALRTHAWADQTRQNLPAAGALSGAVQAPRSCRTRHTRCSSAAAATASLTAGDGNAERAAAFDKRERTHTWSKAATGGVRQARALPQRRSARRGVKDPRRITPAAQPARRAALMIQPTDTVTRAGIGCSGNVRRPTRRQTLLVWRPYAAKRVIPP